MLFIQVGFIKLKVGDIMILVTLGSQKFQFNRLLRQIDQLIENHTIIEKVFAQIGVSDYKPKHYSFKDFLDREEFSEYIDKAGVIITHGGTGAIINAVKRGKKVIAVPRLQQYGEHVDNHQIQLLKEFENMNIISVCYDISELGKIYLDLANKSFQQYESNTDKIIGSIDNFIQQVIR